MKTHVRVHSKPAKDTNGGKIAFKDPKVAKQMSMSSYKYALDIGLWNHGDGKYTSLAPMSNRAIVNKSFRSNRDWSKKLRTS